MKRMITLAVLSIFIALGANAQYRGGMGSYQRVYPTRRTVGHYYGAGWNRPYFGLRIGPTFSTVNSDDAMLDGGNMKTGVDVGIAGGFPLSGFLPLYFETGLYYVEKGGKGNYSGNRFTYNMDYLELPFVFKYIVDINGDFAIHPYLGGYASLGVAGKIKNFGTRQAYSSFGDSDYSFRRGDAGIKIGCGFSYDMLYAELNYDWGLANISHNYFGDARNSAITLNVGINF